MALIVGIDEAGYGPLLGPLVVSAAGFIAPEDRAEADWWQLLSEAVGKEKKGLKGRVLVADSKKAYSPPSGLSHLRRTVLSFLCAQDESAGCPETAGQLLERVCPTALARLAAYPWHSDLPALALGDNPQAVAIAARRLDRALRNHQMAIAALRCQCVDVGWYNQQIGVVKNKSRVLFGHVSELMMQTLRDSGEPAVYFYIDRQGGRSQYYSLLLQVFDGAKLMILAEDDQLSAYRLVWQGRTIEIRFEVGCDERYLPTGLASMLSKWVRELAMQSLNGFFARRCAALRPTAGYWQDGQRFLSDLAILCPDFSYQPEMMIRSV